MRIVLASGVMVLAACDRPATAPVEPGTPSQAQSSAQGDPTIIALMEKANTKLRARGAPLAVEAIQYFTDGVGRPSNRLHQQEFRWVPGDPRRSAQGSAVTYLVATNRGATASGLTATQTKNAIERAFATWNADAPLKKVAVIERAYPGGDVTIFDELSDAAAGTSFDDYKNRAGDFLAADIVNAGWLPRGYFETVGGPGGGRGILAFSVSFIFVDGNGNPTDLNGDNYLDTAPNEVYYNDTFGDPRHPTTGRIGPGASRSPLPASTWKPWHRTRTATRSGWGISGRSRRP